MHCSRPNPTLTLDEAPRSATPLRRGAAGLCDRAVYGGGRARGAEALTIRCAPPACVPVLSGPVRRGGGYHRPHVDAGIGGRVAR